MDSEKTGSVTISDVIERIGLSTHHWYTICATWWVWIFCGWCATTTLFLLDAAGEKGGDWTTLTSSADRLTLGDKSRTLLISGLIAMVGNQVLGTGSDLWGRMFMTQICIANGVVSVIGFLFARAKLLLMLLICMNPFLKDGAGFVTNAMLAEWLPIHWRGIFIISLHVFWNVGRLLITIVWAFVPPSKHWVLFFSIVAIVPVALFVYLLVRGWRYESPRWLAVSGNMDRCVENLKLAAESRHTTEDLPAGWDDPHVLKCSSSSGEAVHGGDRSFSEQVAEVMNPQSRFIIGMLCLIFFGLWYAAYGFFFWAIEYLKLSGLRNAVVPFMIAAPLGKIVANLGLIVGGPGKCIIDTSARIPIMQVGFFGYGLSILLLCTTSNVYMITANAFLGHFFQEIIWGGGCVYLTEAFPTSVRNTASGIVFTVGQTGGILASVVSGEMMELSVFFPMVVMAVACFVAGIACFVLPDENGSKPLADTLSSGDQDYNSLSGVITPRS